MAVKNTSIKDASVKDTVEKVVEKIEPKEATSLAETPKVETSRVETSRGEALRRKSLVELEEEQREKTARSIMYEREKDRKIVKGIFRYYEVPGGELHFPYRKYKGDKVVKYSLKDNNIYELPLGVAKHLNNDCWYPIHSHEIDAKGIAVTRIGKKFRRTGFQSLEFMDTEGLNEQPDIYTAEKV